MSIESGNEETVSKHFPYRNPDGSPGYWHYQKDVIIKTLDAFGRGKRCVVVDAPVGSGKSVIDYTILKCLGPSVYITAQKSLQDQIDNEDWPGVKSVKGRNAYTCNYALRSFKINHSCDIKYDDVGAVTCKEKQAYNYALTPNMFRSIVDSVLNVLQDTSNDRSARRSRTSFANKEELFSTITKIESMASIENKDPKQLFIKSIACNMNPVECPVKSARLMARLSDIAVVNPDAYYALNKTMQLFEGRKHMVVDEAHRLDDAVQRMFRVKIPLGVFNDCFGINLNDIAVLTSIEDFCKAFQDKLKNEIWPIVCAFKVMESMEECFTIHNMQTSNETNISDKNIDAAICKGALSFGRSDGFCLLSVFIEAMKGNGLNDICDTISPQYIEFQDLYNIIRTKYEEKCASIGCDNKLDMDKNLMTKMSNYIRKTDKFISRFDNMVLRHEHAQKTSYSKIQSKTANHLSSISETIESAIYVIDGMVKSKFGENRVFAKELIHTTKSNACLGTEYAKFYYEFEYKEDDPEVLLDIIPLHIGCLLQNLVFRDIQSVVMSSGTWPHPSSTIVGYGFKKNDIEVLRIDPIFPAKNRPIFVNTNISWTDFSQKIEERGVGPMYYYQTEDGAAKFCRELHKLISHIRQKHGKDVNIAVHCGNYGISRLISEHYPGIDDSFLMHLPRVKEIVNKSNGHIIYRQDKDYIINKFCKNPASGLTIVSPSILEGLDFKEDICRAQIILKAPIPNLGDAFCKYKFMGYPEINLKPDKMFLDVKCAIDLNQAYGRVVRGMEDWGETYMMDLALTKRMAKACNVYVEGLTSDSPGDMGKLNIKYIKQGIQVSKDTWGRFRFKWPI